ncbi:MAG: baseplate J/gp47 family protein [Selenomonadaceae bacterium]|nr:baseplate J/gp47 family protein [Selenomonadaceae bacterium]MBQ6758349.1 baseplate J/gp47 family protein [Selenomonadaceae bacterium]MBR0060435.1 baseplate J/gp47 family protein [Selenomonadaceae bacterium]
MTKPDLKFIDIDVDQIEADAKQIIEDELGYTITAANPIWLLFKSLLAIILTLLTLIEFCARMNLLAFATGAYLDAIGQVVGVERIPATAASTTVQINLSAPRQSSTTIAQGTRITADNQTFFSLDEEVVFLAGETQKTSTATCLTLGEIGNGFAPNELSSIVDPQPFLQSIVNVTTSDGGADAEDDESLRERIHIAPESFSCAGPEGAYIARTKEVSSLISDVAVDSSEPGSVEIYLLMEGGTLPSDQMIADVLEHLSAKTVRPLNDEVTVHAPNSVSYNLDVQCFIASEDSINAAQIISKAESAVDEFISWQAGKIGRDLTPSKLVQLLMNAGVKRVQVNSPTFAVVDKISVAVCNSQSVNFAYEDY